MESAIPAATRSPVSSTWATARTLLGPLLAAPHSEFARRSRIKNRRNAAQRDVRFSGSATAFRFSPPLNSSPAIGNATSRRADSMHTTAARIKRSFSTRPSSALSPYRPARATLLFSPISTPRSASVSTVRREASPCRLDGFR